MAQWLKVGYKNGRAKKRGSNHEATYPDGHFYLSLPGHLVGTTERLSWVLEELRIG